MTRDPNYAPFALRRQPKRARLDLVERCWRLCVMPTARELVCGIFQTDAGLEVRAGHRDDLIESQLCRDLASARATADAFRRVLVDELGCIEELPLNGPSDGDERPRVCGER